MYPVSILSVVPRISSKNLMKLMELGLVTTSLSREFLKGLDLEDKAFASNHFVRGNNPRNVEIPRLWYLYLYQKYKGISRSNIVAYKKEVTDYLSRISLEALLGIIRLDRNYELNYRELARRVVNGEIGMEKALDVSHQMTKKALMAIEIFRITRNLEDLEYLSSMTDNSLSLIDYYLNDLVELCSEEVVEWIINKYLASGKSLRNVFGRRYWDESRDFLLKYLLDHHPEALDVFIRQYESMETKTITTIASIDINWRDVLGKVNEKLLPSIVDIINNQT